MKLTINSRVLKSALESTAKAINPKPTIPALANFFIMGDGHRLTITGSDGNTTIKESMECEAEGLALLPINLLELVRTLDDGDIDIEVEGTASVKWKNGASSLPAFDPKDYPDIKDYDGEYLNINGESLISALTHTLPHTSNDTLRPVLGGVMFNAKDDGTIDVVATDSHTLGLYTIKTEHTTPFSFVCPANALKLIYGAAKSGDVEVAKADSGIFFRAGSTTVITREIIGKFPRYESVIPKEFNSTLTAEKGGLLNTIKRILVCASKSSGHLKMSLGMFGSIIEAQDLSFNVSARENPDVEFDGEDLTIGFKGEYLIKCISAIESDTINIKFTGARKAAVVTSVEDASIALIMPVQI